jgi:hypothetical protein
MGGDCYTSDNGPGRPQSKCGTGHKASKNLNSAGVDAAGVTDPACYFSMFSCAASIAAVSGYDVVVKK